MNELGGCVASEVVVTGGRVAGGRVFSSPVVVTGGSVARLVVADVARLVATVVVVALVWPPPAPAAMLLNRMKNLSSVKTPTKNKDLSYSTVKIPNTIESLNANPLPRILIKETRPMLVMIRLF